MQQSKSIMLMSLLPLTVLAIVFYLHMDKAKLEKECAELRVAWAARQNELAEGKEAENIKRRRETLYQEAQASGLLQAPDRLGTGQRLDQLRTAHQIHKFRFELMPQQSLKQGSRFKVTPVTISFSAKLDRDVYGFASKVLQELPGLAIPQSFGLFRKEEKGEDNVEGQLSFLLINHVGERR